MSRAFSKERDDVVEPLLDAHARGTPVRLTATGRSQLELRRAAAADGAERVRLDRLCADIVVVPPPADRSTVAFGAVVDVSSDGSGLRRFTVAGAHETDIAAGKISESSPLGVALIGAGVGDVVTWRRPAGDVRLTVEAIAYDNGGDGGFQPA